MMRINIDFGNNPDEKEDKLKKFLGDAKPFGQITNRVDPPRLRGKKKGIMNKGQEVSAEKRMDAYRRKLKELENQQASNFPGRK